MSRRIFVQGLALALVALPARAADWWVSGSGNNGAAGSQAQPFRTITHAMGVASSGDTIHVLTGDYDVAAGESFPIAIKHDVDIVGEETSPASYPAVGGDAASSAVAALLLVDPTLPGSAGNRTGILVRRLRFVAQDTGGVDAPSAFLVRSKNGYTTEATLDECLCERPEMNDGPGADKPTVGVEAGYGEAHLLVDGCTITPSAVAGVRAIPGAGTNSTNYGQAHLDVFDTLIQVEDEQDALFGIDVAGRASTFVDFFVDVEDSVIDSTQADEGHGIETGFAVRFRPTGACSLQLQHFDFLVMRNIIRGCLGDAFLLLNDPQTSETGTHISLWDFDGNRFVANGGAGVRIVRDETDSEGGGPWGGYVNFISGGNLIAGNAVGVHASGEGGGVFYLCNDTIADNDGYALEIDDTTANGPAVVSNSILYGNNSNGAQHGGTAGWSPSVLGFVVEYTDWKGLSGIGTGNIDADPLFVGSGDYHLSSTSSPCVDAGTNTPNRTLTLTDVDWDGDPRILDGDGDTDEVIDMGVDELVP